MISQFCLSTNVVDLFYWVMNLIIKFRHNYLKRVRDGGGVVSATIAIAAAKGILLSTDKMKLLEYGGHIQLNTTWAYSLLERMNFVKRKATEAKSKHTVENFAELKQCFLDDVVATVSMEEIPPELILNWDQTGIKLVPSSGWTMDQLCSRCVEVTGENDKQLIMAVFCESLANWRFLAHSADLQG